MAQLKERLPAVEENARQREESHQEQKIVLKDTLNAEQAKQKTTRENLQKRLEKASAEANARKGVSLDIENYCTLRLIFDLSFISKITN